MTGLNILLLVLASTLLLVESKPSIDDEVLYDAIREVSAINDVPEEAVYDELTNELETNDASEILDAINYDKNPGHGDAVDQDNDKKDVKESQDAKRTWYSKLGKFDCWTKCGSKSGDCKACPTGYACCRRGWKDSSHSNGVCSAARLITIPCTGYHCCSKKKLAPPKKKNADCWNPCGRKSGDCKACAKGYACCRRGWGDSSHSKGVCKGAQIPCSGYHCCSKKRVSTFHSAIHVTTTIRRFFLTFMTHYRFPNVQFKNLQSNGRFEFHFANKRPTALGYINGFGTNLITGMIKFADRYHGRLVHFWLYPIKRIIYFVKQFGNDKWVAHAAGGPVNAGSCRTANWWSSFDKAGWSTCGSKSQYMRGLYRSASKGLNIKDGIWRLESARCCDQNSQFRGHTCSGGNWRSSLDKNNHWSKCPNGYFMQGLKRSKGSRLHNIENALCCRPSNAKPTWGSCYKQNIVHSFDNKGWSECKANYFMAGLYRSSCDNLYCIEYLYCCRMDFAGGKALLPRQTNIKDKGYPNCGAGWYDVQKQGVNNDYCRWVGNCGCRGKCSWWSCALAGKTYEYSPRGAYKYSATVAYIKVHVPAKKSLARVCEHKNLHLKCSGGSKIGIVAATYGRNSPAHCKGARMNTKNCRSRKSLSVVKSKCDGKSSCSVKASNGVFGDPCVGTFKYLEVTYKCVQAYGDAPDPENDDAADPKDVEAAVPKDVEATVPKDVEAAAPKDVEAAAPKDVEAATPKDVETAAPKDVETAAPKDVEAAAPKDVKAASPKDVEAAAPKDVDAADPSITNSVL